jgi:RimJ/RimL family protein N-acetyltransferase
MKLIPIADILPLVRYLALWDLLRERTPDQNISHEEMPEWEDHVAFVDGEPYLAWYLICEKRVLPCTYRKLGMIYLTHNREVGIQIFKRYQGKGYGKGAIQLLMRKHPGKFYANINPNNTQSIKFFETAFNARLIQHTYVFDCGTQL